MSKSNRKKDESLTPLSIIKKRRLYLLNRKHFTDLLLKVIFLILVVYFLLNYIFGIYVVKNNDMLPKITQSDLVMYYRLEQKYAAGDVVVVRKDDAEYILRIIAVGDEEVDITDKGLVINGATQYDPNIYFETGIYEEGIEFPIKLKSDEFLVLGDSRDGAKDSRYFGPVKRSEIVGKLFMLFRRNNF